MRSFVLAAAVTLATAFPCPKPLDIQDPWIAKNFNLDLFVGDPYFELALHDYTQPSICSCQRSWKTLQNVQPRILDNFTMACPWGIKGLPAKIQISNLSFNTTDQPGVVNGHWAVAGNLVFPDTVVAVGYDEANPLTPYRWALEFQCVEEFGKALFIGINFYSRARVGPDAQKSLAEMMVAAKKAGIDQYWNTTSAGLRLINHDGCQYN